MNLRTRIAAVATTAVCLPALALAAPALAKPGPHPAKSKGDHERVPAPGATATPSATTPGSTATPGATATPAAKKGPKRFVQVGWVTQVGSSSVTMFVQGGNQRSKHSLVTVNVAAGARIARNGRRVKLAELRSGDHIEAKGVGGVADDVKAQGKRTPPSTSTSAPTSTTTSSSTTTAAPATTTTSSSSTTTTTAPR
jgi:hypothetical protein